jgi:hypothetical protein
LLIIARDAGRILMCSPRQLRHLAGTGRFPLLAQMRSADRVRRCLLLGVRPGHAAGIRIREVLGTLAIKHDIAVKDITYAMAYADDMLADTIYNVERELEREIEGEDPG